jgi:hypothetical protein
MTSAADVNDIDVNAFINPGPNFSDLDPETFFTTNKFLGKPMAIELHESINSMYRFGSVVFEDNIGLRERFPLTGNEIISIIYKNKITSDPSTEAFYKIIHFNIFDMTESQIKPNATKDEKYYRKGLKFHLIEAPFYLTYNGTKYQRVFGRDIGDGRVEAPTIDKIFESFLLDSMGLNEDFIELDFHKMTQDVFRISCPYWKPQKFFKYLLDYARDENDSGNVKFFTTSNLDTGLTKVNLKSMIGMFKDPQDGIVHPYTLVDKAAFDTSIRRGEGLPVKTLNQIFYWKFLTYDLSTLTIGLAGGTQFNYQYDGSIGFHFISDNYEQSISRNKYYGNIGIWNTNISNEFSSGHYLGSLNPKVAENYLNNAIISNNFQVRCEVLTNINERVQVGDVVAIQFLSSNPAAVDGQEQIMDEQMSGEWLVEEITDNYSNGKGMRKMVMIKDSFFNLYNPQGVENNSNLAEVTSAIEYDTTNIYDDVRKNGGENQAPLASSANRAINGIRGNIV